MTATNTVASVGFIGLGAMGTPMTRRLTEAGFQVSGFDVSEEARRRVAAFGVKVVDRVEAAVEGNDVVILMLPDSNVVESVVNDPSFLAALKVNAVVGGHELVRAAADACARACADS